MEFRGINPIWRIHGPVLLPKTRRIFVDPDDFYWGGNPISPFFITWHFSFFSVIKLWVNEKRQFRNQGQFCTTISLYIRNKMDRKRCILCHYRFTLLSSLMVVISRSEHMGLVTRNVQWPDLTPFLESLNKMILFASFVAFVKFRGLTPFSLYLSYISS